jgi:hypothetical protein
LGRELGLVDDGQSGAAEPATGLLNIDIDVSGERDAMRGEAGGALARVPPGAQTKIRAAGRNPRQFPRNPSGLHLEKLPGA